MHVKSIDFTLLLIAEELAGTNEYHVGLGYKVEQGVYIHRVGPIVHKSSSILCENVPYAGLSLYICRLTGNTKT